MIKGISKVVWRIPPGAHYFQVKLVQKGGDAKAPPFSKVIEPSDISKEVTGPCGGVFTAPEHDNVHLLVGSAQLQAKKIPTSSIKQAVRDRLGRPCVLLVGTSLTSDDQIHRPLLEAGSQWNG